jgi:chorismate-pyruvate lyase
MEEILAFIEKKKFEFSQLPFFEYLRDQNISPKQRLAFAPCAAPFIMSFGELNRTVFRDEPTNDPIQKIINKHTYEDDHHWLWFLEDLEKLDLNPNKPFTEVLSFLWSEETRASRQVAYELYRCAVKASPIQKLMIIESVEATGNAALQASSQVVRELQVLTKQKEYNFFGASHLIVDTGHAYCSPKAKQLVGSIQIGGNDKREYLKLIEHIFEVFEEFVDELLTYATACCTSQTVSKTIAQSPKKFKPIGVYLVEAGLLKTEQLHEALTQQKLTPLPIGNILASQGWVKQKTIEYLMEKVICSERQLASTESTPFTYQRKFEGNNGANNIFSETSSVTLSDKPMRLGSYLVEASLVSSEQLQAALDEQKSSDIPIGQILSRNGLVNQQTIEYLMEKVVLPERKVAVLS